MTEKLTCVISGSFEFKPEIDLAIDEFEGLGVRVLSPSKGWIARPMREILFSAKNIFHPLPDEVGMTDLEIENSFLEAVARASFLYVIDPDGYVGMSVALEMGWAIARAIPIFASCRISGTLDPDPMWTQRISLIEILSPALVIKSPKIGIMQS